MTDDAAFLHEIAENPDELGPRLRYADYLDEKLDAASAVRAEFIRVQCALEHLPESDPSFASVSERERQILDANWHLWMRPICQAIGEPLPVPPLKRSWGEWARRRLRKVETSEIIPRLELFWINEPTPKHIITLSLSGRRQNNSFLKYARFTRGFVSDVILNARASRGPTYLDRLFERTPISSLYLNGFDRQAMRHLSQKGWLRRLRKLDLSFSDADILIELIDAPDARFIRSLELFPVAYEGHHASLLLPEAKALQPEEIGFHHLEMTADDLRAMADSAFMSRVKHLILEGVAFEESALVHLLEQTPLQHLELVGLTALQIEREIGNRLRERFPNLKLSARAHPRD